MKIFKKFIISLNINNQQTNKQSLAMSKLKKKNIRQNSKFYVNEKKMMHFFEYLKLKKVKIIDRNVKNYVMNKLRQFVNYKNKSNNE